LPRGGSGRVAWPPFLCGGRARFRAHAHAEPRGHATRGKKQGRAETFAFRGRGT